MTVPALTRKLTEVHITTRKSRLKGQSYIMERSIRRGTTEIDTIRKSATKRIITESRGGKGRINRR
jgi:hypothetical protein